MPLFSIIVPVYNKEKTLCQCIDSVIRQKCQDWELILLNDGSNDGSERVIKQYNDNRIRYFSHANRGVSYTRNRGIHEAFGKYIIFLDADDYWDETFLQKIEDSIRVHPVDVYFTGITKVRRDGSVTRHFFPYEGLIHSSEMKKTFYELQRNSQLYGYVSNKVVRRDFLIEHHLFFDESIHHAEDLEFFLRCYAQCPLFFYIKDCGYFYIRYDEGTSMFDKNMDYLSLIEIQKKLRKFCDGYMSEDDKKHYSMMIKKYVQSAISETSLLKIGTIPDKVKQINADDEINQYCQVNDNVLWLMCKVFSHQLYIRVAQIILKLCVR